MQPSVLVHMYFTRRGSFIWCTVPFCLIQSVFVLYWLPWLVEMRPGTWNELECTVQVIYNLHGSRRKFSSEVTNRLMKTMYPLLLLFKGQNEVSDLISMKTISCEHGSSLFNCYDHHHILLFTYNHIVKNQNLQNIINIKKRKIPRSRWPEIKTKYIFKCIL